jgi:hypothetical protein
MVKLNRQVHRFSDKSGRALEVCLVAKLEHFQRRPNKNALHKQLFRSWLQTLTRARRKNIFYRVKGGGIEPPLPLDGTPTIPAFAVVNPTNTGRPIPVLVTFTKDIQISLNMPLRQRLESLLHRRRILKPATDPGTPGSCIT